MARAITTQKKTINTIVAWGIAFLIFFPILWTIPGALLLPAALQNLSYAEVMGACLGAGLLVTLRAATGWIARVMALIPLPIVMGMLAGVFLPFGLGLVSAIGAAPWLGIATVGPFVALSASPRLARVCPPLLAALLAGAAFIAVTNGFQPAGPFSLALAEPVLVRPAFSAEAMLEALGHDVLYVEDTGQSCYDPVGATFVEDGGRNAAYLGRALERLDESLGRRWFLRDAAGRTFGTPPEEVAAFCRSADLFINVSALHQPNHFYGDGPEEDTIESHAAALSYVDGQLDRLFDAITKETLVIVCSDHGTAYGEEGWFGHRIGHPVVYTVPYAEFLLEAS